jgi:hypothetical protein
MGTIVAGKNVVASVGILENIFFQLLNVFFLSSLSSAQK